jgi:hypothetical protein
MTPLHWQGHDHCQCDARPAYDCEALKRVANLSVTLAVTSDIIMEAANLNLTIVNAMMARRRGLGLAAARPGPTRHPAQVAGPWSRRRSDTTHPGHRGTEPAGESDSEPGPARRRRAVAGSAREV